MLGFDYIYCLLAVLGAIGVCLFPLWPPEVRLGVYYLSLAAGGFVVVILGLCIRKYHLFVTSGELDSWSCVCVRSDPCLSNRR